jgi:hypothetical protein
MMGMVITLFESSSTMRDFPVPDEFTIGEHITEPLGSLVRYVEMV